MPSVNEPTCAPDDLPEEMQRIILRNRGGCQCQAPGAMPPCWRCVEPATAEEVMKAEAEWIEVKAERAAAQRAIEEREIQAAIDAEIRNTQANW